MGRLVSFIAAFLVYLCVGTVLSVCVFVSVAWVKGYLDRDKIAGLIAVIRGELSHTMPNKGEEIVEAQPKSLSFEELDQRRTTYTRHLELREQGLQNALDQLAGERERLLREKKTFEMLVSDYRKQIKDADEGRVKKGYEDVRLIWENIKPKLAKELILKMIDADEKDEVVGIFASMPIPKQAKIVSEFKTEDEQKKLDDILRRIREGGVGVTPTGALTPDASASTNPRP
jgi:hypothetical protein